MKQSWFPAVGLLAAAICVCGTVPASAAPELISLDLHGSRHMSMPDEIISIAVGDPEVATVVEVPGSKREFLVVSHSQGTTTLFVWTQSGTRYEYIVGVSAEDVGQAKIIERAINLPDVHVKMVGKKVRLTGTVENQYERNWAVKTAALYLSENNGGGTSITTGSHAATAIAAQSSLSSEAGGTVGGSTLGEEGSVIDLLVMRNPSQIRLEAQVIAINPEDAKNLGVVYGSGTGTSLTGDPGVFYAGESYGSGGTSFRNNPWQWLSDRHDAINLAVRALIRESRAKILSRPSIATMSGEEAVIQVGGEIPYTVRSTDGTPTTQFKDYGIILQFKPTLDGEGRIVSAIHTEVSMPSGETVGDQPILDRRWADSVVTMRPGSTMVIGGLMDSRDYKSVYKFPFLGDIPILGEFFKYTSKSRDKQELIILVTPYLVEEEDTTKARMSSDMKGLYDQGRRETAAQEEVDLDEPLPEEDKAETKESAPKATDRSILGKYLNRSVLPSDYSKSNK
ncbi:MAG: pilus assembly protein N-terminal domain-containing protein [Selenomonadaceae bacterium]|nr:pilus assembly protein N-terminal domain-containing protein [Selenomonadaceae bacterium]